MLHQQIPLSTCFLKLPEAAEVAIVGATTLFRAEPLSGISGSVAKPVLYGVGGQSRGAATYVVTALGNPQRAGLNRGDPQGSVRWRSIIGSAIVVALVGLALYALSIGRARSDEQLCPKYGACVPASAFECQDITRSSLIQRVCYSAEKQYMIVKLGDKGTDYHYCSIPADVVAAFLAAESMGRFYNQNIKSGKPTAPMIAGRTRCLHSSPVQQEPDKGCPKHPDRLRRRLPALQKRFRGHLVPRS